MRRYRRSDREHVLALIQADQLPGQPPATADNLADALAGRSPVDSGWWAELAELRTDVLVNDSPTAAGQADGQAVGVVSYARRPRDGAGILLWLHAKEHPARVAALVNHALEQLHGCSTIHAFDFATALTRGLEALPARHRPATAAALRAAGFSGSDLWRYMRRDLTDSDDRHWRLASLRITTAKSLDPKGWLLTAHRGGSAIGHATIGAPEHGIGVLWWIGVNDDYRGSGAGRALLNAALQRLCTAGARQVILYVDDDEPPGGDRDRSAANRLYDRAGFTEVDRLISYTRTTADHTPATAPDRKDAVKSPGAHPEHAAHH